MSADTWSLYTVSVSWLLVRPTGSNLSLPLGTCQSRSYNSKLHVNAPPERTLASVLPQLCLLKTSTNVGCYYERITVHYEPWSVSHTASHWRLTLGSANAAAHDIMSAILKVCQKSESWIDAYNEEQPCQMSSRLKRQSLRVIPTSVSVSVFENTAVSVQYRYYRLRPSGKFQCTWHMSSSCLAVCCCYLFIVSLCGLLLRRRVRNFRDFIF